MSATPDFMPLYKQVYKMLVTRIADGKWRPAEALPSEQALALELRVSQGTVRKALDLMANERLVERRQGKGTYVSEHTQEGTLFRFFRLFGPEGRRLVPESEVESVARRPSKAADRARLQLRDAAQVIEIRRTRRIDGVPAIVENIVVPVEIFPNLDRRAALPNTLYSLYQSEYGVSIVTAEEELRAEAASKDDARRLKIGAGTPLLVINRVAVALDGRKVEWRRSRCITRNLSYLSIVR